MRWLLLFIALAAQNEVRGLYVAAHKHSILDNETHDHHHEPEHEQNPDDEATVMDAPVVDEGLDPDLLSSSLFASNIASALADETSTECPSVCPAVYNPICGSDGKTYSNPCRMKVASCQNGQKIVKVHDGLCQDLTVENVTADSAESVEEPEREGNAHGLNSGAFSRIFGRQNPAGAVSGSGEAPDPRLINWSGVVPPPSPNVHAFGSDPWTQPKQSVYQDLYNQQYNYYPYGGYGYDYDYGYNYPSLYEDYAEPSYPYSDYDECPKCDCDKYRENYDENEHEEDVDSRDNEHDEETTNHSVDHEYNPKTNEDDEPDYNNEIEDYLRTAKVEVVNEEAKARKKRSVEPYDYYALHKPSRFLEQHNVGYRIKNDLRYRLREEKYPLHYGHILSASSPYGKPRRFYDYTDFHVGYETDAFRRAPIGPRLGKNWVGHGFPVYGHNLYKLWKPVYGLPVNKNFVRGHKGYEVVVKPGVYRIVAVMDDKKGLIIQNVGGKHHHQRYILSNILYDGTLHKFQALAAWKDRHAKFVKVYNPRLGLVFLVRPSSLHGGHPKSYNYYGGKHHDHHRFSHLKHEPLLLKPQNVVHKVKLSHKKPHHVKHHDY